MEVRLISARVMEFLLMIGDCSLVQQFSLRVKSFDPIDARRGMYAYGPKSLAVLIFSAKVSHHVAEHSPVN